MKNKSKTSTITDEQSRKGNGLIARLRGYFFAGIVVTAPISITVYVTYVFLRFVDTNVIRVFPGLGEHGIYGYTTIPGLGVITALFFFIFMGWFARNILGRFFFRLSEYIVDRMPVIRTIYGAIKQIFETVMASKSQAFREVVMMEYPRKGVWSVGFVTGKSEGEVQRLIDAETINVFVPTTPNPTSGYLLFVPKKDLIYLDMSVEEGVKLVVSAGIITPPDRKTLSSSKKVATKAAAKKKAPRKKKAAKKA
jgi:uncharacterized membrane protein